jgi:3-phenylpropionate/trans-cinnamate dioxygenase ferredoxin subunit
MTRLPIGPAELGDGAMRGVELPDGRLVLVARLGDGFHAMDDVCNHAGCLLSAGRLDGARVICPCHDMAFDVRSGAGIEPVLCEDQRAYRVVADGGALFLEER